MRIAQQFEGLFMNFQISQCIPFGLRIRALNKNDHRSGGAVKGGYPYLCIEHMIKLKKRKKWSVVQYLCQLRNKKNKMFVIYC